MTLHVGGLTFSNLYGSLAGFYLAEGATQNILFDITVHVEGRKYTIVIKLISISLFYKRNDCG